MKTPKLEYVWAVKSRMIGKAISIFYDLVKKKGGAEKILHRIVISQTHDIHICLHMQINMCLVNNSTRFYGSHPANQPG